MSKIIAVDFDGTLCENCYPEIGAPNITVIESLKKRQEDGDKLILWTCRYGNRLDEAIEWSEKQGLIFDAINSNLPSIIEKYGIGGRKIYADEYWDDKNVNLVDFEEVDETDTFRRAKNEIDLAIKLEIGEASEEGIGFDYGVACYESAFKAFKSLYKDGHSGMSIAITKSILNRLIDGKPLTAVEDTDDSWDDAHFDDGEEKIYQHKRMGSLFKRVDKDGNIKYRDSDRFICVDIFSKDTYRFGLVNSVMDKMFPIKMPYMPFDKNWKVYCSDFLTNKENGDFDTVAIHYVLPPFGEEFIPINRYFKSDENDKEWIEITEEDYNARKEKKICEE